MRSQRFYTSFISSLLSSLLSSSSLLLRPLLRPSPRAVLTKQTRTRGITEATAAKELVASYTLGSYPLSFPVQVVSSGTHPGGKPLTLPAGALNLQSAHWYSVLETIRRRTALLPPSGRPSIPETAIERSAIASFPSCHS